MDKRQRILTGDRPTGRLHLGHYVGSLQNRVRLQNTYECFFLIADLHTLTTRPQKTAIAEIMPNAVEMILDYLAAGIDPNISTIYLQSAVPEIFTLNLIFEMLVTVSRLQRLPSVKEMARNANLSEMPFGLLGYPILQAGDIVLPRAHLVPVGKDNLAHIELTREIVRRFNHLYGEVFPVPEPMVGDVPVLVGTDGAAKMSKSLGNAIMLSDDEKTVKKKVRSMYTDPQRIRADIPGKVEGNPVFVYHDIFNSDTDEVRNLKKRYQNGTVGDVEVKDKLTLALNTFLAPLREKRMEFAARRGFAAEVLYDGTMRMQKEARETLAMVQTAMGLNGAWKRIRRQVEKIRKKLS